MKAIASYNGSSATQLAYELLCQGRSPLDACVEGLTLVEDDPEEFTVGYGGLPNEEGVVELDAAVMDGPTHRGAGVAALTHVRHPTRVARLVMQQTDRALLVGEGALKFALANGFSRENLLTEKARNMWHLWRRMRSAGDDWRKPADGEFDADTRAYLEKLFRKRQGTVHCAAIDASGNVACGTSTSGHAFKLPGRVGDSAILGAGLYVDNEAGSCGSIGHGEANMQNLSSFAAVGLMRDGMSPAEAGLEVLRRVASKAPPGERDRKCRPTFGLQLFLLAKDGSHAGVTMWGTKQLSVTDASGTRLEDCVALFEKDE